MTDLWERWHTEEPSDGPDNWSPEEFRAWVRRANVLDLGDCYAPGPDFTCIYHGERCDDLYWYRNEAVWIIWSDGKGSDVEGFRGWYRRELSKGQPVPMTARWHAGGLGYEPESS